MGELAHISRTSCVFMYMYIYSWVSCVALFASRFVLPCPVFLMDDLKSCIYFASLLTTAFSFMLSLSSPVHHAGCDALVEVLLDLYVQPTELSR